MAESTEISWCDSTQNFWIGCTEIAPACTNCYAAALDKRTGGNHWGDVPRRRTSEHNWNEPLRWQRKAGEFFALHGRRRRVFVSSMSDFFDNQVPGKWRDDAWDVIRQCPDLDWLILTKRPSNIHKMLPDFWEEIKDRIWMGTTVEDQTRAEQNIKWLMALNCKVRFLSMEPLLGPVFLNSIKIKSLIHDSQSLWLHPLIGQTSTADMARYPTGQKIDWVIIGGESGPKARPMHQWWVDLIVDACEKAGTKIHLKQWGNWVPADRSDVAGALLVEPWGHGQTSLPGGGPPPMYMRRVKEKHNDVFRGRRIKEFPA